VLPPEKPDDSKGVGSDWSRALREASPLLGIGTTMAASLALGLLGGRWIDVKLGTWPLFFLVGGALGVASSMYQLYSLLMRPKK
jgi:ATP synthase protein I